MTNLEQCKQEIDAVLERNGANLTVEVEVDSSHYCIDYLKLSVVIKDEELKIKGDNSHFLRYGNGIVGPI